MASLIKQRMDIDRSILIGRCFLVIGGALAAGGIVGLVLTGQLAAWFALGYGVAGISYGVFAYRRGRRALSSFENENGVGAGVQKPVAVPRKPPR